MAEISILTGRPVGLEKQQGKVARDIKRQEQIANAVVVSEDLKSEGGQIIIGRIREQLKDRITELVHDDIKCQTLLLVLNEMGTDIKIAQDTSDRMVKEAIQVELSKSGNRR